MPSKLKECDHSNRKATRVENMSIGTLFYSSNKCAIMMRVFTDYSDKIGGKIGGVCLYSLDKDFRVGDIFYYQFAQEREVVEPGKCVELFNE